MINGVYGIIHNNVPYASYIAINADPSDLGVRWFNYCKNENAVMKCVLDVQNSYIVDVSNDPKEYDASIQQALHEAGITNVSLPQFKDAIDDHYYETKDTFHSAILTFQFMQLQDKWFFINEANTLKDEYDCQWGYMYNTEIQKMHVYRSAQEILSISVIDNIGHDFTAHILEYTGEY